MTRIPTLLLLSLIAASAQERDLGLQLEQNPPMRIIARTPPEPAAVTDTFEGGYFRNVVDRPYPHFHATECEFEVCNDGNTLLSPAAGITPTPRTSLGL